VTLDLGDPRHDISARDKRTIGFLRQLFPGLSQVSMPQIRPNMRFTYTN